MATAGPRVDPLDANKDKQEQCLLQEARPVAAVAAQPIHYSARKLATEDHVRSIDAYRACSSLALELCTHMLVTLAVVSTQPLMVFPVYACCQLGVARCTSSTWRELCDSVALVF